MMCLGFPLIQISMLKGGYYPWWSGWHWRWQRREKRRDKSFHNCRWKCSESPWLCSREGSWSAWGGWPSEPGGILHGRRGTGGGEKADVGEALNDEEAEDDVFGGVPEHLVLDDGHEHENLEEEDDGAGNQEGVFLDEPQGDSVPSSINRYQEYWRYCSKAQLWSTFEQLRRD